MRTFLLVMGASIVSAILFGSPIPPLYPYQVVACGGPGQPVCTVHGITNVQPVPGLTNADFQAFFAGFPRGATENYVWTITDVNSSGVAIGPVDGFTAQIHTSFVFDAGKVVCCTLDSPFTLTDINDNGFVVGANAVGPFGFVAFCCGPFSGQVPLSISFTTPLPLFTTFTAIDDNNNIAATDFRLGQRYDLFETPEPSSIVLFSALAAVAALQARRRIRGTCRCGSRA